MENIILSILEKKQKENSLFVVEYILFDGLTVVGKGTRRTVLKRK